MLDLKENGKNINPFSYFNTEEDVLNFTKNVIEDNNKDDFLKDASILLVNSIFFYLLENCLEEDWNLVNVKKLINLCSVKEGECLSTVDVMFGDLNVNSKALSFYKSYKIASGDNFELVIRNCLEKLDSIEIKKKDKTENTILKLIKQLIRKIKGVER